MASNYHTEFSQKKVRAGARPSTRAGVSPSSIKAPEKVASWSSPGPTWQGSFNSKTKAKVVKSYAKKKGLA